MQAAALRYLIGHKSTSELDASVFIDGRLAAPWVEAAHIRQFTASIDSAIAQMERLKLEFKTWLWADKDRAYALTLKYNTLYPLPQKRVFDGSYLTLPDSNK